MTVSKSLMVLVPTKAPTAVRSALGPMVGGESSAAHCYEVALEAASESRLSYEEALACVPFLARATLRNGHVEHVYSDGHFFRSLKNEFWDLNGDYSPDVTYSKPRDGDHQRDIIMIENHRTRAI